MTWASEQDTLTLTGHAVAEDELARAQAQVELTVGRTEVLAAGELSTYDLEWLKRAVAYQAVWSQGQPDLHTRLNVTQLAQDGMAATFNPDALVLAPLAKKAIKRLSWMGGSRSIPVEPFQPMWRRRWPVGGPLVDFEHEPWRPL